MALRRQPDADHAGHVGSPEGSLSLIPNPSSIPGIYRRPLPKEGGGRRSVSDKSAARSEADRRRGFRLQGQGSVTTLARSVKAPLASLRERLDDVRARIANAAAVSGRPAGAVTLVGVVKTVPSERVTAAVELGVSDL